MEHIVCGNGHSLHMYRYDSLENELKRIKFIEFALGLKTPEWNLHNPHAHWCENNNIKGVGYCLTLIFYQQWLML